VTAGASLNLKRFAHGFVVPPLKVIRFQVFLLFTVVLSLCVLGLCYIAVVAIWESVRGDRKLKELEREMRLEDY
jgi:hypothetical protein